MSVVSLNRVAEKKKQNAEGSRLQLAVFAGGEGLLTRLIALLEGGGLQVVRPEDVRIHPSVSSDGETATTVLEVIDPDPGAPSADPPQALSLAEAEAVHIKRVLELCGGNRSRTAAALGVARSTLIRKLHEIRVREKHG